MVKKYLQCPHCKRDITNGAKKCHHCGAWVSRYRRFFDSVKSNIPLLTIAALVFMVWQILIMQETVKQGRQSIDLLKDTITKMDSSLSLDIQDLAIRIQQKELDTKNLVISKEKSRPKMVILSPKVTVSDSDSVFIYYNIENRGESDAKDFILSVTTRILNSDRKIDTTFTWIYNKVFKGKTMVARACFYPDFQADFISKIYISYRWEEFREPYKDSSFYYHTYQGDKEKKGFSTNIMDEEVLKKLGF